MVPEKTFKRTPRRSKKSILKEINPEYSLEELMLKLKLQYFGHLMQKVIFSLEKDPDVWKDWGQEEKRVTKDEMVGWYHWLNGHEFEQTLGDSEGQGSLACCSAWGCKESDSTSWLNNWSSHSVRIPLMAARVFVAALDFLCCAAQTSRGGFSCYRAWALGSVGSVVVGLDLVTLWQVGSSQCVFSRSVVSGSVWPHEL